MGLPQNTRYAQPSLINGLPTSQPYPTPHPSTPSHLFVSQIFTLLPLLEGVGPEEGIWGLEPASWAELSGDLRAWLMGEAEAMEARGQTTCTSCSRLSEAEARDSTAPRDLDVAVASRALRASQTPTSPTGAPDPLTLHPEAPSLERREALNALA